jgi:hypothetical protein
MRISRQMRRRIERKGANRADISHIIDYTASQYAAVVALCLRDELGFGKKRAQRFMQKVDHVFTSINEGYLSLDDVIETVQEELGITVPYREA